METHEREDERADLRARKPGARRRAAEPKNWSRSAPSSRRRKKTRWRSITSSANSPRSTPAPGRASRRPDWNWSAWRARIEEARAQRERNQLLVAEKEQARFDQEKALEIARGEFDATASARARDRRRVFGVARRRWPGSKNAPARRRPPPRVSKRKCGRSTARREQLAGDLERMGVERTRLLADNIELDQKAQHARRSHGGSGRRRRTADGAGDRRPRQRWPRSTKRSSSLRIDAQAAQEQRAQIELELVRKQSELKYLDETSRKELNEAASAIAAAEEAARRRRTPEAGGAGGERRRNRAALSGSPRPHRSSGTGESAGARRIPGSPAALRVPERAAAGPDRFHPRHGESHPGTRHRIAPPLQGSLREPSTRTSRKCSARCSAAARARCA